MSNEGGLLEKACEGVLSLDLPACVKDSQLLYVCVNDAYARFAGKSAKDMPGRTSRVIFNKAEDVDREDKERRCLVFATDEIATCKSSLLAESHAIRCERFIDEEGQIYLYEVFETMPRFEPSGEASSIAEPSVPQAMAGEGASLPDGTLHVLQSLPVGVMLLSPDLTIEYANQCFYDLWELPDQPDLAGKPYRDYLQLGYESGLYDLGTITFEEMYQDRLAKLKSIEGRTSREVESKSGKCTLLSKTRIAGGRILITFSDRTAVRAREREIAEAQEEVQRLGEYMRDATTAMAQGLALVKDGKIILSNEAIARMFDVPAASLAPGESWLPFFDSCAARGDFGNETEIAETLAYWQESVANGEPFSSLIHVDGRRWLNLETTISAGKYWLVIVTDVTDMKMREAELEGLLARAEAADRAKSEFLANMSHEIRTPMNGILGMAELLSKSRLDTRQKTFTDVIVKSGNALLTIINDILDFSKMDAGQMSLRSAPFDPVEAIEDVASLLAAQAQEKNIELLVNIDASVQHTVDGDAARFRQIVTNLVGNAIKFTETGHVLIRLGAEATDQSELLLKLVVEDTGVGIARDKLDTIFEKFSQVDSSSTRRHEGTGLGLAITVGLVGLFGGKIDIQSEVSKGSTFSITLPLPIVAKRAEAVYLPMDMHRPSVLIIDDNAVNRDILTEQLGSWNIDCCAAESGAIGLAILEEAAALGLQTDAVILDYHMPGMHGFEVARKMRGNPTLADIPIIMLTSLDAGDEDAADTKIEAHLMKPVRARLLRKTLNDVVRSARIRRSGDMMGTVSAPKSATPASPTPHRETAPPQKSVPGTESQLDVLVAEDNDVNQIVFTQILQQSGLRFRIVENGKKAVEAWRNEQPSLILMDVSMPVMNGHQATRAIREIEESTGDDGARVPIIGVTAHALEMDRDLCIAAGMDDYISKPISPELLQAKIAGWLSKRQLEALPN